MSFARTTFKRPSLASTGLAFVLVVMLVACDSGTESATPRSAPATAQSGAGQAITITSTAFADGQSIPQQYSCDGRSISPPLQWGEPPAGTQSFALIVEDPDAPGGVYTHWLLYDLPAATRSLPENVPAAESLDGGGTQGRNSGGKIGYSGPCPPSGTHHYIFKLYALDTKVGLAAGADKAQLEQAMDRHVLATGELVGTYSK